MKVLELFAGSRSFSKVAEELGMETYTTDIVKFDKIDNVCDIMDIDEFDIIDGLDGVPDIIWASPPCTYFSVASIGHHWNKNHTPKTEQAELGIKIVKKTIEIIKYFQLNPAIGNPNLKYYIENPRGKLRKLNLLDKVPFRRTVWYCQYGDKRAKPTDIWTNDFNWIPRPVCKNGNPNCHHEPAPRGSKTGTQGLKGNYERSIVPDELCREILENI